MVTFHSRSEMRDGKTRKMPAGSPSRLRTSRRYEITTLSVRPEATPANSTSALGRERCGAHVATAEGRR
jgi:hypothetical protein